jgi:UDP-glucuronate decarboxylase
LPQDDPKRRKPVIGKAADALGWQPKVSIDKGLEATISYFSLCMATNTREATVASIDSARAARARLPKQRERRLKAGSSREHVQGDAQEDICESQD